MSDKMLGFNRYHLVLQGRWRKQFMLISGFFFFDYVSTTFFCKNPHDEWNIIARTFMINFKSIPIGTTMFFLLTCTMWYLVIFMISWFTNHVKEQGMSSFYRLLDLCNFIVFAFVAGWDFGFGATSWFWHIPLFYRALVGSVIYLAIYLFWIDRRNVFKKGVRISDARARAWMD